MSCYLSFLFNVLLKIKKNKTKGNVIFFSIKKARFLFVFVFFSENPIASDFHCICENERKFCFFIKSATNQQQKQKVFFFKFFFY